MPLNISIDVDGTLLDENGRLAKNVRESLLRLKAKGHRLQLWSTGGADYAKKTAVRFQLSDLFESYATKPDVVVDDIPETARPVASIRVDKEQNFHLAIKLLETMVENNVETVLCPSPSLVQYIARMQNEAAGAKNRLGSLVVEGVAFHPVPFFGNIESAQVITIGLNPAVTEFANCREWPQKMDEYDLTFRLVNYFRLSGIMFPLAHDWFLDVSQFLNIVNCPQKIASAHVDMCPWTTIAPRSRGPFWPFVDQQIDNWLAKTLAFGMGSAKLILIIESPKAGGLEKARQERVKELIKKTFPLWRGKIRVQKKEKLVEWGCKHRKSLSDYLGLSAITG